MSGYDYTLRDATEEDLQAIVRLNDAAFGQADEGRIVESLHFDGDNLLSLVAEQDGEILGHIQFFPIECLFAREPARFAGLGPISVTPEAQKSGIGSALIKEGLSRLKADGMQRVFVLGHKDYYPRFGFSVEETAGFGAPWGGPNFMAIVLNSNGPAFGELSYPDAFSG